MLALPNQRWSLDFVHDQMASGRRFRVLNVVDDVTRECLAAVPDTSISGRRVVRELTELIAQRGKPGMIVSDNGTELTSNAVLAWCGSQWNATRAAGQMSLARHARTIQASENLGLCPVQALGRTRRLGTPSQKRWSIWGLTDDWRQHMIEQHQRLRHVSAAGGVGALCERSWSITRK